ACGRGFADRQTDLALRHGHARDGVHHQQDIFAGVTEILGDGYGYAGTFYTAHGSLVACNGDDDGSLETLLAQVVGNEFLYFAAALPDESNDIYVGAGAPCNHAEQGTLSDT